jgi:hypothetical protein
MITSRTSNSFPCYPHLGPLPCPIAPRPCFTLQTLPQTTCSTSMLTTRTEGGGLITKTLIIRTCGYPQWRTARGFGHIVYVFPALNVACSISALTCRRIPRLHACRLSECYLAVERMRRRDRRELPNPAAQMRDAIPP